MEAHILTVLALLVGQLHLVAGSCSFPSSISGQRYFRAYNMEYDKISYIEFNNDITTWWEPLPLPTYYKQDIECLDSVGNETSFYYVNKVEGGDPSCAHLTVMGDVIIHKDTSAPARGETAPTADYCKQHVGNSSEILAFYFKEGPPDASFSFVDCPFPEASYRMTYDFQGDSECVGSEVSFMNVTGDTITFSNCRNDALGSGFGVDEVKLTAKCAGALKGGAVGMHHDPHIVILVDLPNGPSGLNTYHCLRYETEDERKFTIHLSAGQSKKAECAASHVTDTRIGADKILAPCDPECDHGQCDDATCICDDGYTGSMCETYIDDCESNPCQNEATCQDNIAGYLCHCADGYDGTDCENDIDECSPISICQNGATCSNSDGSYSCICADGFTGVDCESNIDECTWTPPICENGATCKDNNARYTCLCADGFTGDRCESDIDECVVTPGICENDATCENIDGGYICHCSEGYTGENCDADIDECVENPSSACENGICENEPRGSYTCHCDPGYTGIKCETDINECDIEERCNYSGRCQDGVNDYTCDCELGFTGPYCETDINECEENDTICTNGTCLNKIGGFECNCTDGSRGSRCQFFTSVCLGTKPCLNHGVCTDAGVDNFLCSCLEDYEGRRCEDERDDQKWLTVFLIILALVIIAAVLVAVYVCNRRYNEREKDYNSIHNSVYSNSGTDKFANTLQGTWYPDYSSGTSVMVYN